MYRSNLLTVQQTRGLLEFVADLERGDVPLHDRATRFLDGLARLVGADLLTLSRVTAAKPGEFPRIIASVVGGGLRDRAAPYFVEYARVQHDRPLARDPVLRELTERASMARPVFTLRRQDLLTDRQWYASEHVGDYRLAAGIDHCIYAQTYLPGAGGAIRLTVNRERGSRGFSAAACALVDLAFERLAAWLGEGLSAAPPTSLRAPPPRPAADLDALPERWLGVLARLAAGDSEKQAAAALGLSPHTVHEYAKCLHGHFGVHSRGELLARCIPLLRSGGRSVPPPGARAT
ncbi:MAG: hypothetical protein JNM07_10945 [Phycisphaerae bacterium]|nr:hypothetical protein [Phycisphaerae bacterium]